ncbi:adenosine receptor A1-like [Paramuricea clavata]|uniref:Adenosine receptor A1-like n=1 Tax=Paramuricea clavata TaxID=317549 RepID=A0A7D9DRA4_PARCT|nr:adenosine receptor A1-like [Paramuricea clavata]
MPSTGVQGNQVLLYIFGILAIVLNGVLLASMYKERKKIFVTRISFLVANLAFADCLNGLFLIILRQPITEIEYKNNTRLLVELPLVWTAFCASLLTVILMAAERLLIVTLPMEWSTLLTIPRSLLCILAVWLLSIGCGVAIHYKRYYAQFVTCLIVEISSLFLIATHIYIVRMLQRREIQRMVVNKNPSQDSPCLPTPPNKNNAHRKVTVVVTILLSVMIITCVPYFACIQMFVINNTFDKTVADKVNLEVYHIVLTYAFALLYVNFFMNPIIYAWRLRMYRKAFYSLVGRSSS